jgi:hypothetical protein
VPVDAGCTAHDDKVKRLRAITLAIPTFFNMAASYGWRPVVPMGRRIASVPGRCTESDRI